MKSLRFYICTNEIVKPLCSAADILAPSVTMYSVGQICGFTEDPNNMHKGCFEEIRLPGPEPVEKENK